MGLNFIEYLLGTFRIFFNLFFECHSKDDNNLILGDFNFVEDDLDKGQGMDQHDKKIFNLWQDFKRRVGIVDAF